MSCRCWRHLLDFPKQGLKQNRRELDLADADTIKEEDEHYPSLADITLEGVPAVRNLITDLAMDVLLYQSAYRKHIAGIVQRECNNIYKIFKDRNPGFRGTVSLCGHSLGSAILFDILCRQPPGHLAPNNVHRNIKSEASSTIKSDEYYPLNFDCDNFFCLGSPIALFQMLEGKTVAGKSSDSYLGSDKSTLGVSDGARLHHDFSRNSDRSDGSKLNDLQLHKSSPRCNQLFNIFHPSDPISYRIEPLISPAMASLKPQQLPVVKRTIWAASGQGLTNIGARVGQSVGSLFSNFATGVASSFLNRSLGLGDGASAQTSSAHDPQHKAEHSGRNTSSPEAADTSEQKDVPQDAPTLIDQQLETLYDGFQKTRSKQENFSGRFENASEGDRAKKLRDEEAKVRALNSNGRVDYSIQE